MKGGIVWREGKGGRRQGRERLKVDAGIGPVVEKEGEEKYKRRKCQTRQEG